LVVVLVEVVLFIALAATVVLFVVGAFVVFVNFFFFRC
jgi:hypothetical protein